MISAYVIFTEANGNTLAGESQVQVNLGKLGGAGATPLAVPISQFQFEIQNVTNIGSATSGAGAGKVQFQPVTIERPVDRASPLLFQMCASGQHFQQVQLLVAKTGGQGPAAGQEAAFLVYTLSLVFIQNISWSFTTGGNVMETLNLEAGSIGVKFLDTSTGAVANGNWDQVSNTAVTGPVAPSAS